MEKSNLKWYLIIFALLIVVAALSLFLIFHKPAPLYRPVHGFLLHHSHRVLTINDVNRIQNWMTFDYINKVFKLPSDYLKNNLNISDSTLSQSCTLSIYKQ